MEAGSTVPSGEAANSRAISIGEESDPNQKAKRR
jgi:hypothetical protein